MEPRIDASPRLLAIETSGITGSVALVAGDRLVASRLLDASQRSTQSLAPAIDALLHHAGWRPPELQVIAVVVGPGSFTGLRVGVATAKTLAYALEASVVGVITQDALATQLESSVTHEGASLSIVLDAYRQELFVRDYQRTAGVWSPAGPAYLATRANWLATRMPESYVAGPMADPLAPQLPAGVTILGSNRSEPLAVFVARHALGRWRAGETDDLWRLAPLYLRPSAAEEQRGRGVVRFDLDRPAG